MSLQSISNARLGVVMNNAEKPMIPTTAAETAFLMTTPLRVSTRDNTRELNGNSKKKKTGTECCAWTNSPAQLHGDRHCHRIF